MVKNQLFKIEYTYGHTTDQNDLRPDFALGFTSGSVNVVAPLANEAIQKFLLDLVLKYSATSVHDVNDPEFTVPVFTSLNVTLLQEGIIE